MIIVAKTMEELEGAMEAVNGFVKTAPTFIAKVQVIYYSQYILFDEELFSLVVDGRESYRIVYKN